MKSLTSEDLQHVIPHLLFCLVQLRLQDGQTDVQLLDTVAELSVCPV